MSEMKLDDAYRSIPFWSWNDKLVPKKLIQQIHWMQKNGIGGFFMHARTGLETEYLSDEWMECIKVCAKEAKKYGMKAWAYDENGWPSGFAGGELLKKEENRDKYILTKIGEYDMEATVSYLLSDSKLIRVSLPVHDTKGKYLNLYIYTATSTADILNPDVVKNFLMLTHEKYKEYFGDDFQNMIEGFFTDEPQYHRWNTPYTDMIEKYWKETFGEDILDGLGLLFVEKEGYRQFRYRYWKSMQHLMLQNYAKQVYDWCDDNGVKLTGHYVEEERISSQIMCCGGVMPFYEYEHIPGIDKLQKGTPPAVGAKQVGSVARQLGKQQVLTESYAMCGWDVRLSDLRRITGVQFVNGVNLICQHLLPYSERGMRKYDYPAHYSDINPWVAEEFKRFTDYYARLGVILGEGKECVNVAVLHPLRSGYFDYKRDLSEDGLGIQRLDDHLHDTCHMLASNGVDYHFLDETLLAKYGYVRDGHIGCGKCEYEYLILPYVLTMDATTEELLRKYIETGGKVLILGDKPSYREADPYPYKYLESNVTLEEIAKVQPYEVRYQDTQISSTLRIYNNETYLYIVNGSETRVETQIYDFGEGIHSFRKLDLLGGTETKVSLEITLEPGEDAVLVPCRDIPEMTKQMVPYSLQFTEAEVRIKENYLPIDKVSYSKDGEEFLESILVPELFQKLLRERYEGKIYFKYEFRIEHLPEEIYLRMEQNHAVNCWINDHKLQHGICSEEEYMQQYDISKHVKYGSNTFVVEVDWFEKEQVYYALFGDKVTESLRNSITYDTELQPIELIGRFGVYTNGDVAQDKDVRYLRMNDFYIGKTPIKISEPVKEGLPFHAGEMILRQKLFFEQTNILLHVSGDYQTATVTLNGKEAGKLFFDRDLDVSDYLVEGENDVEVRFLVSNRNRMGPHHSIADKRGPVTPFLFTGEEGSHTDYDIKKFYTM